MRLLGLGERDVTEGEHPCRLHCPWSPWAPSSGLASQTCELCRCTGSGTMFYCHRAPIFSFYIKQPVLPPCWVPVCGFFRHWGIETPPQPHPQDRMTLGKPHFLKGGRQAPTPSEKSEASCVIVVKSLSCSEVLGITYTYFIQIAGRLKRGSSYKEHSS